MCTQYLPPYPLHTTPTTSNHSPPTTHDPPPHRHRHRSQQQHQQQQSSGKQNMHSKTSNNDGSSPASAKKRADALDRRTTTVPLPLNVTLTTRTCGQWRCTGSAVYFATMDLPMHLRNATSVGDRGSKARHAHRRRRLFFSHAPVPGARSFPNGKGASASIPGLTHSL